MTEGKSRWVIQLVQSSFAKQSFEFLPYASGLLQAYVMRYATDISRYIFLPFWIERKPLAETLPQIALADVFAFSTYIWSYQYNLSLARAIKQQKPQSLTVFGGPQVPDTAEDFLRNHPYVDVCVHGEGEITFFKLLESLPDKDWKEIPGISWLDDSGVFHHNPPAPRQRDLDQFPSPYLMGLFDELLKQKDYNWIAQWETNRGCPFSCTFCDWGSNVASKIHKFGLERVKREVEWFGRNQIHTVNGCDANFGILPRDLEITDYMVETRQQTGFPKILFIQGAKNAVERSYEVNKKLIAAGLGDMVTLSLQSLNPTVLKAIRRDNISLAAYRELQERCQRDGIETYTDFLVGLPGETYESFADGVSQMINEGQHHQVNFFNVYVLPNAELNDPHYRQTHGIVTVRTPHYQHGYPYDPSPEAQESQEMVIATHSYAAADWVKMRALAWWIEILYMLRKPLQIPLLLIHMHTGIPFRELFEFYAFGDLSGTSLLAQLQGFLIQKAQAITGGEAELCLVRNPRQPYWLSVPDFVITGLTPPEIRKAFYAEQEQVLTRLLQSRGQSLPPGLLTEALTLNEALIEAYAGQRPFSLTLRYNVWEAVTAFLRGQPWQLRSGKFKHQRDWVGWPFYQLKVEEEREEARQKRAP